MSKIDEKISEIKGFQTTIDNLLEKNEITTREDKHPKKWMVEVCYQRENVAMGMVFCKDVGTGTFPPHIHKEVREYLICVKGSFIFSIDGRTVREVHEGECVAVPKNAVHKSKPLEDDTQIAWVCVPSDKGIFGDKRIG